MYTHVFNLVVIYDYFMFTSFLMFSFIMLENTEVVNFSNLDNYFFKVDMYQLY